MKIRFLAAALLAGTAASVASAQSGVLYSNSFESREMGPEWSSNSRLEWWYPTFTTFNGNYSNSYTRLTLPARPPASTGGTGENGGGGGRQYILYTVTFDFYAIDSWDGNDTRFGQDRFEVLANGVSLMRDTFSNHAGISQSFRAADIGGRDLGFDDRWQDAIYRRVILDFTIPDGFPIQITWRDGGLQGMNDESWGIDNVEVSYRTVPTPGAGLVLAAGIGAACRRRRQ